MLLPPPCPAAACSLAPCPVGIKWWRGGDAPAHQTIVFLPLLWLFAARGGTSCAAPLWFLGTPPPPLVDFGRRKEPDSSSFANLASLRRYHRCAVLIALGVWPSRVLDSHAAPVGGGAGGMSFWGGGEVELFCAARNICTCRGRSCRHVTFRSSALAPPQPINPSPCRRVPPSLPLPLLPHCGHRVTRWRCAY
jgi:hypothetical protein